MSRVALEPAFVLHHRPYRDSSRLLEVLGRQHGRVGLVARGARRPRSPWRSVLQPFTPVYLSWTARGELGTLTAAEARGAALQLPQARLMSAYYVSELVLRLLPRHDPSSDVFDAYAHALAGLADSDEEVALRIFEKRLLEATGYGLLLSHDADSGEPVAEDRYYQYRLERGPVAVGAAEGELVFAGASLLALDREALSETSSRRDARRLLRAALDLYLGSAPLRTRAVARATRRQGRQPPA